MRVNGQALNITEGTLEEAFALKEVLTEALREPVLTLSS